MCVCGGVGGVGCVRDRRVLRDWNVLALCQAHETHPVHKHLTRAQVINKYNSDEEWKEAFEVARCLLFSVV